MNKIITILISVFLSSLYFTSLYSQDYSDLNGYVKIKCVTTDQSKISTIEIVFNGTDKPQALIDKKWATLKNAPPMSEFIEVYKSNFNLFEEKGLIFVESIKFDTTLMIGQITFTPVKDSKIINDKIISSNIECLTIEDEINVSVTQSEKKGESFIKKLLKKIN